VIEVSIEQGLVEGFRHEGVECPWVNGSGYRPRKRCAGCGEPSGRPSRGGKAPEVYRRQTCTSWAAQSWPSSSYARSLILTALGELQVL